MKFLECVFHAGREFPWEKQLRLHATRASRVKNPEVECGGAQEGAGGGRGKESSSLHTAVGQLL